MNAAVALNNLLCGQAPPRTAKSELRTWIAWIGIGGCIYGAVMGLYGGVGGDRVWQVVYSSLKVPLLLWVTFFLTLPSFVVVNSLLGLRSDFGDVWTALLRAQSTSAVVLAALSPYTALWYLSSADYNEAILFNAVMFGTASIAAQILLWRAYRPLVRRNPRHRLLLKCWIIVYAFVGIQMGWVLRPFIGDPNTPTRFFREGAWGNAYLVVFEMVTGLFKG